MFGKCPCQEEMGFCCQRRKQKDTGVQVCVFKYWQPSGPVVINTEGSVLGWGDWTLWRGKAPLTITGTMDQLVESVQKAACLQMMYDRRLESRQGSPMMVPVDPEGMTPLIPGLPDSLKPAGIQLQGKIQNTPISGRVMWGEIAQLRRMKRRDAAWCKQMSIYCTEARGLYTLSEAAHFKQVGSLS